MRILRYPDERLRQKATPVETFDEELSGLLDEMVKAMCGAGGVGLAANQVGDPRSACVIDASGTGENPIRMLNPRIVARGGLQHGSEGCLSLPGCYENLDRNSRVVVEFERPDGSTERIRAEGFLARIVQHEVGHLDGELFADHLSRSKRDHIGRLVGDTDGWKR